METCSYWDNVVVTRVLRRHIDNGPVQTVQLEEWKHVYVLLQMENGLKGAHESSVYFKQLEGVV